MPVSTAFVAALGLCITSAALEGLAAGQGVRQRLAGLNMPRYAPPFAVWVAIGALYYIICFGVSFRLLRAGLGLSVQKGAFALLLVLMVINILWNVVFFRRRDLQASYYWFWPYIVVALGLLFTLAYADATAAWLFLPYVVYLSYALWWGRRLWQLNARVRGSAN